MKISLLTPWEGPDPAFWVPNDYVVMIADRRGDFKSEGKAPSPDQQADDIFQVIEWAAIQPWSNGNVGMLGVSALASNQYFTASHQPPPPHLKAIVPWEGQMDRYRDARRSQAERLMAVQSVAMAGENLLLAAAAEGWGACWMCAPLFAGEEARRALDLPAAWEPQGLVLLGQAAEAPRPRGRINLEDVTAWR